MKIYILNCLNKQVAFLNIDDLLNDIRVLIMENTHFTITFKQINQDEYNAMTEFEGY